MEFKQETNPYFGQIINDAYSNYLSGGEIAKNNTEDNFAVRATNPRDYSKPYSNITFGNSSLGGVSSSVNNGFKVETPSMGSIGEQASQTAPKEKVSRHFTNQMVNQAFENFNTFVNNVDTSEGQAYNPDDVYNWFDPNGTYYNKYGDLSYTSEDGAERKFSDYLDNERGNFYWTDDSTLTLTNGNTITVGELKQAVLDRRQTGIDYRIAVKESQAQIDEILAGYPELQKAVVAEDTANGNGKDYYATARSMLITLNESFDILNYVVGLDNPSDALVSQARIEQAYQMATQFGNLTPNKQLTDYWNYYSSIEGNGFKNWVLQNSGAKKQEVLPEGWTSTIDKAGNTIYISPEGKYTYESPSGITYSKTSGLENMSTDAQYQLYLQSDEYKEDKTRILYCGTLGRWYDALPSLTDYEHMVDAGIIQKESKYEIDNVSTAGKNITHNITYDYSTAHYDYITGIIKDNNPNFFRELLQTEDYAELNQYMIDEGIIPKSAAGTLQYDTIGIKELNQALDSLTAIYSKTFDASAMSTTNLPEGWEFEYDRDGNVYYISPEGRSTYTLPTEARRTEADVNGTYELMCMTKALVEELGGHTDLSAWSNFVLWKDDLLWNADKWVSTAVKGILELERALFDVKHENERLNLEVAYNRNQYFSDKEIMDIAKSVSELPQFVFDITENMMNMTLDWAVGGSGSLAVMAARIFGEQSNETYDPDTDTFNVGLAMVRTVSEVASEMAFGGPFYKGVFNPIAKIARSNAPTLVKFGACVVLSGLGEGTEELIASFMNTHGDLFLRQLDAITDEQMSHMVLEEMGYEFIVAAACAALGVAGGATVNSVRTGNFQGGMNAYLNSVMTITPSEALRAVETNKVVNNVTPTQAAQWLAANKNSFNGYTRARIVELSGISEGTIARINEATDAVKAEIESKITDETTPEEFAQIFSNNETIRAAVESIYGTGSQTVEDFITLIELKIKKSCLTKDSNGNTTLGEINVANMLSEVDTIFTGLVNEAVSTNILYRADPNEVKNDNDRTTFIMVNRDNPDVVFEAISIWNNKSTEEWEEKLGEVKDRNPENEYKEAEDIYLRSLSESKLSYEQELESLKAEYKALVENGSKISALQTEAPEGYTIINADDIGEGYTLTIVPTAKLEEIQGNISSVESKINEVGNKLSLGNEVASGLRTAVSNGITDTQIRNFELYNPAPQNKFSQKQLDLASNTWDSAKASATVKGDTEIGGINKGGLNMQRATELYLAEMQKAGFNKEIATSMLLTSKLELYKNAENKQQANGLETQITEVLNAFDDVFKPAYDLNYNNEAFFDEKKDTAFIHSPNQDKSENISVIAGELRPTLAEVTTLRNIVNNGTTITDDGTVMIKENEDTYKEVQKIITGAYSSNIDFKTYSSAIKVFSNWLSGEKNIGQTVNGFKTESRQYTHDNSDIYRTAPENLKEDMERISDLYGSKKISEMTDEEIADVYPVLQAMARHLSTIRQFRVESMFYSFGQDITEAVEQAPKEKTAIAKLSEKMNGKLFNIETALSIELGNSPAAQQIRAIVNSYMGAKMQWRDNVYGLWYKDKNIIDSLDAAQQDEITVNGVTITGSEAMCAFRLLLSGEDIVSKGNGLKCGDTWIVNGDKAMQSYAKTNTISTEEYNTRFQERAELRERLISELRAQLQNKSYFEVINNALIYSYARAVQLANVGRFESYGRLLEQKDSYAPHERADEGYLIKNMGSKIVHTQDATHNLGSYVNSGADMAVRDCFEQLVDYTNRMADQVYNTALGRNLIKLNMISGKYGEHVELDKGMNSIIDKLIHGNTESIGDTFLGRLASKYAIAHLALNPSSAFKQVPSFTMANAYAEAHQSDYFGTPYGKVADYLYDMYIGNGDIATRENGDYSELLQSAYAVYNLRNQEAQKYYDTYGVISNWAMHSVRNFDSMTTGGVTRVVTASTIRQIYEAYNEAHPQAKLTAEQVCDVILGKETGLSEEVEADLFNSFQNRLEANLTVAMFTQPTSDIMMAPNLGAWKYFLPYMGQRIQYLNKVFQAFNDIETATTPELKQDAIDQKNATLRALGIQSALMSLITTAFSFLDPKQRKKFFNEDETFNWTYLLGKLTMNGLSSIFSIVPIIGDAASYILNKPVSKLTGAEIYDPSASNVLVWLYDDFNNLKAGYDALIDGKDMSDYDMTKLLDTGMNIATATFGIPFNNIARTGDYVSSFYTIGSDIVSGGDSALNQSRLKDMIVSVFKGEDAVWIDTSLDNIVNSAKITAIFDENQDVFMPTASYVSDWITAHGKENSDGEFKNADLTTKSNFIWMLNDMKAEGIITDNDIANVVASWNSRYPDGQITAENLSDATYTTKGKEWLNGDKEFSKPESISFEAGTKNRDEWIDMYTKAGLLNDAGEFSYDAEVVGRAIANGYVTKDNYAMYGLTENQYLAGMDKAQPYILYDIYSRLGGAAKWDDDGDGKLSTTELKAMHNSKDGNALAHKIEEEYGSFDSLFGYKDNESMDKYDESLIPVHYDPTVSYTNADLKKTVEGLAWLTDKEDGSFSNIMATAFKAGAKSEAVWRSMCDKAGFVDDDGNISFSPTNVAEAIHAGYVTEDNYKQYGISNKTFNSAMEKMTGYNLYDELISILPAGTEYDTNDDGQLSAREMVALHNDYQMLDNGQYVYDLLTSNVDVTKGFFNTGNYQSMDKADANKEKTDKAEEMKDVFDTDNSGKITQSDLSHYTEGLARTLSDEELYYIYDTVISTAAESSVKKNSGMAAILNEYNRRKKEWFIANNSNSFTPATFDSLF